MSHDHHSSAGGMDHSMHSMHSMHSDHDHPSSTQQPSDTPGAVHSHFGSLHLMQMSFHFGYNESAVLIEGWKIDSYASLITSMIGIFILATLYEALKCYRGYLSWRMLKPEHYHAIGAAGEAPREVKEASSAEASIGSHRVSDPSAVGAPLPRWFHCVQTVLHVLQVTISMLLMLVFMTYNLWLCLSVIAGAGTGYFLFGWRRYLVGTDQRSHCH